MGSERKIALSLLKRLIHANQGNISFPAPPLPLLAPPILPFPNTRNMRACKFSSDCSLSDFSYSPMLFNKTQTFRLSFYQWTSFHTKLQSLSSLSRSEAVPIVEWPCLLYPKFNLRAFPDPKAPQRLLGFPSTLKAMGKLQYRSQLVWRRFRVFSAFNFPLLYNGPLFACGKSRSP